MNARRTTRRYRCLVAAAFLCLALLAPIFGSTLPRPEVFGGTIDVGGISRPVELFGRWAFWPSVFVDPATQASGFSRFERFPASWSSYGAGLLSSRGYGSYAIRITGLNPSVLYAFWFPGYSCAACYFANGQELYAAGTPATTRAGEKPHWDSEVVALPSDGLTEVTLVLHLSNFNDIYPACPTAVQFGSFDALSAARAHKRNLMIIPFAAILAMGAYFIALFVFQRGEKACLWLGVLCVNFALRISCYDEFMLQDFMPFVPTALMFRLGYLTFALAPAAFAGFLRAYFPEELPKVPAAAIISVSLVYCAMSLLAPIDFFTGILVPFQAFALLVSLAMILVVFRAALGRRPGAILFLAGFTFFFFVVVHDILVANREIDGVFLSHYGILGIVAAMAIIVVGRFTGAFNAVEAAAGELEKVNQSLARFVPNEFLRFLGKTSITEVALGDNIRKDMCVMFVHLGIDVPLQGAAARLTMLEMFNDTLHRVNPLIQKYRGFIDKYLAEGVMVLFPDDPAKAVRCSLEIRAAIGEYNVEREREGLPSIQFAAGIHRGTLMLGTIGEAERMDSTVISDAVNTASRLLRFAVSKDASVVVSETIATDPRVASDPELDLSSHGEVRLKGRSSPVSVYEVRPA